MTLTSETDKIFDLGTTSFLFPTNTPPKNICGSLSSSHFLDPKKTTWTFLAGWLRAQIGFVEQEPVLFDRPLSDNIAYGSAAGARSTEIQGAARRANAHGFIAQLAKGAEDEKWLKMVVGCWLVVGWLLVVCFSILGERIEAQNGPKSKSKHGTLQFLEIERTKCIFNGVRESLFA